MMMMMMMMLMLMLAAAAAAVVVVGVVTVTVMVTVTMTPPNGQCFQEVVDFTHRVGSVNVCFAAIAKELGLSEVHDKITDFVFAVAALTLEALDALLISMPHFTEYGATCSGQMQSLVQMMS